MLRVNVGLSRKLSQDYNSTGYSINLDGELTAPVSDPEAVIEQVKELYDLAEEALERQIERSRGEEAIASRDEDFSGRRPSDREMSPRLISNGSGRHGGSGRSPAGRPASGSNGEAATAKQINYLLNIGRRQRLSTKQLEDKIAEVLGQAVGVYDLGKRDAASVIDALTNDAAPAGERR